MKNPEKITIEKRKEKISPQYQKIVSGIDHNSTGMLRRLYPGEFEGIYEGLYEKYKKYTGPSLSYPGTTSIDIDSLDIEEGSEALEEYRVESERYIQDAKKFLQEKSLDEIYNRAKTIVDNLVNEKAFGVAEQIAKNFLSEKDAKKFYSKYFDHEIKGLEALKDQREIDNKTKEIFNYFLNVITDIGEEKFMKLATLIQNESILFDLIRKALRYDKVKKINEDTAKRIHDKVYEWMGSMLKRGLRESAQKEFESYEKAGIFNIDDEKDFKLYQKIAEK